MYSTIVGMFAVYFELLPNVVHCGVVPSAAQEELFSNYTTVLDGNHIPILSSCQRPHNS